MENTLFTIGIGTYQMPKDESLFEMLRQISERAKQLGTKVVLDTAKVYGNTELIGKFFTENPDLRSHFFLIMKDGINLTDGAQPYVTDPDELGLRLDGCHKLLGKVDVFLLHRVHHAWTPTSHSEKIDALYLKLVEFKKGGKCDNIGISECNPTILSYLATKFKDDVNFFECAWSPFCRRIELNGTYEVVMKHNIKVITYSSILSGLLNDGILKLNPGALTPADLRTAVFKILGIESNPWENTIGFYDGIYIKQNIQIVQNFMKFAKNNNLSPAELSLACASHMGFIPIPGSSKLNRILENVFSAKTINSEIFSQVMKITDGFDGSPNPDYLDYFK